MYAWQIAADLSLCWMMMPMIMGYASDLQSPEPEKPLRFFTKAEDMLAYLLTSSEQLFIIAEIHLRSKNGIQLRKTILANIFLRKKSIPFIYLSIYKSREELDL